MQHKWNLMALLIRLSKMMETVSQMNSTSPILQKHPLPLGSRMTSCYVSYLTIRMPQNANWMRSTTFNQWVAYIFPLSCASSSQRHIFSTYMTEGPPDRLDLIRFTAHSIFDSSGTKSFTIKGSTTTGYSPPGGACDGTRQPITMSSD